MIARLALPVAALGIAIATASGAVRINTTDSVPVGLYSVQREVSARRGMLALVCLPAELGRFGLQRGYIGVGECPGGSESVLKPVAAVTGDVVEVKAAGVKVDGVLIVPPALPRDSAGRETSAVQPGTYPVPDSAVWLLSGHNARSWDSRYFGPVPASSVRGEARPLAVWP